MMRTGSTFALRPSHARFLPEPLGLAHAHSCTHGDALACLTQASHSSLLLDTFPLKPSLDTELAATTSAS